MAQLLKFEALGYRSIQGRFARQSKALETEKRAAVRDGGRLAVEYLRAEAPEDTGEFKRGFAYRTDVRGRATSATVYVRGAHAFLLPMIVEGTRKHPITPHGDYPLRFFWPKGPEGPKTYYFMSVEHPGTEPNDFVTRAQERMDADLRSVVNRAAERVNWL